MSIIRRKIEVGRTMAVAVLNDNDGGRYTISVEVPGLPARHDNDHSYDTEGQALIAATKLAESLVMHLN